MNGCECSGMVWQEMVPPSPHPTHSQSFILKGEWIEGNLREKKKVKLDEQELELQSSPHNPQCPNRRKGKPWSPNVRKDHEGQTVSVHWVILCH